MARTARVLGPVENRNRSLRGQEAAQKVLADFTNPTFIQHLTQRFPMIAAHLGFEIEAVGVTYG